MANSETPRSGGKAGASRATGSRAGTSGGGTGIDQVHATPAHGDQLSGSGQGTAAGIEGGRYTAGPGGSDRASHDRGIRELVREKAAVQLNSQKDRLTSGLGSVAGAIREATKQLREQDHSGVADYVDSAAAQLERFSKQLRERNIGDVANSVQSFARRQPTIFLGASFALGLIGARFLKSSGQHRDTDTSYPPPAGPYAERSRPDASATSRPYAAAPGRVGTSRPSLTPSTPTSGSAGRGIGGSEDRDRTVTGGTERRDEVGGAATGNRSDLER
jgi:hypothetical protein